MLILAVVLTGYIAAYRRGERGLEG